LILPGPVDWKSKKESETGVTNESPIDVACLARYFVQTILASCSCLWRSCHVVAARYRQAAQKAAMRPPADACEYVLSAANQGKLEDILTPSEPDDSSKVALPKGFEGRGDVFFDSIVFRKFLDINNDGKLERVFVTSQGTLQLKEFVAFYADKDLELSISADPAVNWDQMDADFAFVQYRGVNYLLGHNEASLNYLAHIDAKNSMRIVCLFGQRQKPFQSLISGNNAEICAVALEGKIEPADYTGKHSLTSEAVEQAGLINTSPSEEAALIDIDNDGKKEVVVELSALAAAGCEALSGQAGNPSDVAEGRMRHYRCSGARSFLASSGLSGCATRPPMKNGGSACST